MKKFFARYNWYWPWAVAYATGAIVEGFELPWWGSILVCLASITLYMHLIYKFRWDEEEVKFVKQLKDLTYHAEQLTDALTKDDREDRVEH